MKSKRWYDIFLALAAVILIVSNIAATKLVVIGPIITDGGAILFPLAYILNDILTEVYGYKYARRAIWVATALLLFSVFFLTIARLLPAATDYTDQTAYDAIFGFMPRIVLASITAFVVGSFINSIVLAKLKIATAGRQLWLRLLGSTIAGELLDTLIFAIVAFGGILGAKDMVIFIVVGWTFKVSLEVLLMPITYRLVAFVKRAENIDTYDRLTDFNPFRLRV